MGESKIPVADLASSYDELGQQASTKLQPRFAAIGLALTSLTVENLSLPPEVEQMIDRKSSMNIAGNLDQYMKYQTAEAIREAANNPDGGIASAGAGLGAGMAMGQMMSQMLNKPADAPVAGNGGVQPSNAASQAAPVVNGVSCTQCSHVLQENEKFCAECGTPVQRRNFAASAATSSRLQRNSVPIAGPKPNRRRIL